MCPRPPSWFHARHRFASMVSLTIDRMPEKEWLAFPQLSLHDQQCQFCENNRNQHRTFATCKMKNGAKFTTFEVEQDFHTCSGDVYGVLTLQSQVDDG